MKAVTSIVLFIARLFIASVFIFGGATKVIFYQENADYMTAHGMTFVPFFLVGAVIVELLGGLSLLLGYKTRFGAAVLILFLIPVTLIFHAFWTLSGLDQELAQMMFLKNVAIGGGLLYVLCCGSGGCAFDSCCCRPKPQDPTNPT